MPRASYKPGRFSDQTRLLVIERDKWKCRDCGKHSARFEVHHIIPVSRGGTGEPANLLTLCAPCHISRHRVLDGKPETDWEKFRKELEK